LSGESLPRKEDRVKKGLCRNHDGDADIQWDAQDWLDEGDHLQGNPQDPDDDEFNPERSPIDVIMQCALSGCEVTGLPTRYLPHGKVMHIYRLYQATMQAWLEQTEAGLSGQEGEPQVRNELRRGPASYQQFLKRYKVKWRKCLKSRKSSDHAMCQTCFELQQMLDNRNATPAKKRQAIAADRVSWFELNL
jgi:hypothetical protein